MVYANNSKNYNTITGIYDTWFPRQGLSETIIVKCIIFQALDKNFEKHTWKMQDIWFPEHMYNENVENA